MLHRRVLILVDTDSARFALTNMSSSSALSRKVLLRIAKAKCDVPSFPRYSRVPTHSNIVDLVSRLDFSIMCLLVARMVHANVSDMI